MKGIKKKKKKKKTSQCSLTAESDYLGVLPFNFQDLRSSDSQPLRVYQEIIPGLRGLDSDGNGPRERL